MILIRYLECSEQKKKATASNMENTATTARISGIESSRQTQFEGVTVSTGFIWSLQDTILRLERNQQDFIKQLEHANSLAAEYHETAVMYQRKYDAALHEMQELKHQHIRETAELAEKLNCAEEETRDERALKEEYTQQIEGLKQLLAECEARNHCEEEEEQEQEMSPVSVASPSPREQQRPQPIQSFNTCYSESEEDEDEGEYEDEGEGEGAYYHDGDTESDGEYYNDYENQECQCFECREMYAAANANANNDLCQCNECCPDS